jgi:formiminoglutamase
MKCRQKYKKTLCLRNALLGDIHMIQHMVPYDGWAAMPEPREKLDRRLASIICSDSSIEDISEGDIVLLGIPQDIGIQRNGGRIGAAHAPFSVRECLGTFSLNGLGKHQPKIHDIGNIMCEGRTLEDIRANHHEIVKELLQKSARVIIIGGGHDIAFPSSCAMIDSFEAQSIINIDPHLDVRERIDGLGHSGTPFREMLEYGKPSEFIEFGTQAFTAATHHREYIKQSGGRIITYDHIRAMGSAPDQLSELMQAMCEADHEIYVTFDMDAVNSAFAPGVSASAPIGFSADEIVQMAFVAAAKGARIIDIAEVNPLYDVDKRTSRLAALMIANCIAGWNSRL